MTPNEINERAQRLRDHAAAEATTAEVAAARVLAERESTNRVKAEVQRAQRQLAHEFADWAARHSIPFDRPRKKIRRTLGDRLRGVPSHAPAAWALISTHQLVNLGDGKSQSFDLDLFVDTAGELHLVVDTGPDVRGPTLDQIGIDGLKEAIAAQVVRHGVPW